MSQSKTTDNHNAAGKLALRRYFLRTYHAGTPIHVLDCFQATGFLWGELRKEFPLESYWGVDLKPRKGRVKIDSARILDQPGWTQNVIDLDAYGSPWTHWLALLRHAPAHDLTVFLTMGSNPMSGGGELPAVVRAAMGLHFRHALPHFIRRLLDLALHTMLGLAAAHGRTIVEAREAPPGPNARYLGLRLTRFTRRTIPALFSEKKPWP